MKAGRKLAHRSAGQGFSWEQYRPLADIVKIGEGVKFSGEEWRVLEAKNRVELWRDALVTELSLTPKKNRPRTRGASPPRSQQRAVPHNEGDIVLDGNCLFYREIFSSSRKRSGRRKSYLNRSDLSTCKRWCNKGWT